MNERESKKTCIKKMRRKGQGEIAKGKTKKEKKMNGGQGGKGSR